MAERDAASFVRWLRRDNEARMADRTERVYWGLNKTQRKHRAYMQRPDLSPLERGEVVPAHRPAERVCCDGACREGRECPRFPAVKPDPERDRLTWLDVVIGLVVVTVVVHVAWFLRQ